MSDRSPGKPFVLASNSAMASSSMHFDLRPANDVRSRLLYFPITFLPAGVPAATQEIDTAPHQRDRPDYSRLDDIDEPDERKVTSPLLAEEPEQCLELVRQLIHPFGKSQS